ncbi:MAG: ABC transporter substrate-binding protein [Xanthomonadaceae bacterium]|nr:ABC transporter substrate-binding protein [Xanthomonadaceae bacterium]
MRKAGNWLMGLLLGAGLGSAQATISDNEIRIGLVSDFSSVYREIGWGSEIAAEMAIEDFGGTVRGKKIRLLVRDHAVDTERAMRHARDLHENHRVDVFLDMAGTDISIAMQRYARENDILAIHTGTASSILTGAECSPLGIHWVYDTYALAGGTVAAALAEGADSWYFITVDYTYGHTLQADATAVIERHGGRVLGSSPHPLRAADFSRQLAEAAQSGAKAIAFASSGRDTNLALLQAYELGMRQDGRQMLVPLQLMESALGELGQYAIQGLRTTVAFYWNFDEQTRAWSERFRARAGYNPAMYHAGVYSALMHYFKAVEATGSDDPRTVIAKMRELPINDFFARNGRLREDGRMVHDMYLLEVKRPTEVGELGDYYKVVRVIPGEEAFRPLADGGCPYLAD